MTDPAARALPKRLGTFLDRFVGCFGRRAHRRYASRYIQGLLNDSERKSMQPMHGRLSDPGSYQGLQHFITHSIWEVRPFWQRLRALLPVRRGVLAIDDTGLPRQGKFSVGKSELGFDHFEGRSYPGCNHHAVLAAITYAFLQLERRHRTNALPTFPEIRNLVRELLATLFFAERPQWLNLALSFQRNPPLRI